MCASDMPRCLIIGARGFIGSALAAEAVRRGCEVGAITRENYADFQGRETDWLIHAGGNSRKYLDEQDPARGFEENVAGVAAALRDFRFRRFILISSGAVYPREDDPARNGEETVLGPNQPTRYGFHKWLAELLAQYSAPGRLIFRVGGCVGPGLRKNALYDLLSGGPFFVHPDSEFQYLDTRDLAAAVFGILAAGAPDGSIFNLSGRGVVSIREAAAWANLPVPAASASLPRVRAELNIARAAALVPLPGTTETVRRFIREVQAGSIRLGPGD